MGVSGKGGEEAKPRKPCKDKSTFSTTWGALDLSSCWVGTSSRLVGTNYPFLILRSEGFIQGCKLMMELMNRRSMSMLMLVVSVWGVYHRNDSFILSSCRKCTRHASHGPN